VDTSTVTLISDYDVHVGLLQCNPYCHGNENLVSTIKEWNYW